jgi:hypothetical protein
LNIYHQGYGSSVCPLSLIRGKRSARVQRATIEEQRQELQNQIRELKNRVIKILRMEISVFNCNILVSTPCSNASK